MGISYNTSYWKVYYFFINLDYKEQNLLVGIIKEDTEEKAIDNINKSISKQPNNVNFVKEYLSARCCTEKEAIKILEPNTIKEISDNIKEIKIWL